MSIKLEKSRLLAVLVILVLGGLSGCTSVESSQQGWQTSTLYFGRNIGRTEGVSEKDWGSFLNETVTPKFPEGLTVVDGLGQYQADDKTLIKERSKILILVHPKDEKIRGEVKAIIDSYKAQFKQESVLWVEARSKVSFR